MIGRGGDGTNQPRGATETPGQAIRNLLTEGPHSAYELSGLVHLAFDLLWGEALWAEMRGTGVEVLVLEPGPTVSEVREVAGEIRADGEPAANVVSVALEALGPQPSVVSGWFNWLRASAIRLVPGSTAVLLAEGVILEQAPEAMR